MPPPCLIMNLLFQERIYVATSDFVPFVGDPRERRGYVAIPPTLGPREGRGDVATSDFVPFAIATVAGN